MPRRPEWLPVAEWELRRVLQRKDFIVSVALLPALIVGSIFAVAWFRQRDQGKVRRVAVVRAGAPVVADSALLPPLPGFAWILPPEGERDLEPLRAAVREKRYAGAVILPEAYARGDSVDFIVLRAGAQWARDVRRHLGAVARVERLAGRGLSPGDYADFDKPLAWRETAVLAEGRSARADRVVAASLAMLLLTGLFVTNSYLAIGISGEKQARVTEVIVSAVPPQAWMDGKLVAYTLIGLTQSVFWGLCLVGLAIGLTRTLPPAVNPWTIGFALVFTELGFAFYTALNALIMATIKDLQSTSKFQAYFFFLPMVPLFFLEGLIDQPDSVTNMVLSLLPPFSPLMMPARLALGGAAIWEAAVALVLLAIGCHLMRLAAGHAFRIAMLMYGKELNLPELWRWARER